VPVRLAALPRLDVLTQPKLSRACSVRLHVFSTQNALCKLVVLIYTLRRSDARNTVHVTGLASLTSWSGKLDW
jgi:hypothetical protein